VYVACSTQCFGRHSLEDALGILAELGFSKFEAAIHEHGRQLRPSEVAADVPRAVSQLRYGPGLTAAAFSVDIDAPTEQEYQRQLLAICRLARLASVPLLVLRAAPRDSDLDTEVERLTQVVRLADNEGILVTVSTLLNTLTEDPNVAVTLCERVKGLGLTLDPSHYVAGPHQNKGYDVVFPHVRHVHLRDTGRSPDQLQVRVGQGQIEYGRIVAQLERQQYERLLSVDIHDIPDAPFAMEPEVRKLKFLLESLV
jgi:sugar phosphate isomerase/epimerase